MKDGRGKKEGERMGGRESTENVGRKIKRTEGQRGNEEKKGKRR